jgi:hypothetical protein
MTDQHDHEPDAASYDCRVCAEPWPCEAAREDWLHTMTPTQLRINQWIALEQAYPVLEGMSHRDAWDRFLGWAGTPIV